MSEFKRGFDETGLQALRDALQQPRHWWRDLLSLWRPSGHPSGDDGLRLAIRNGYMNFYRWGQSVARVAVDAKRRPYVEVHAKYVLSKPERHTAASNEYVSLMADTIVRPLGLGTLPYEGDATLRSWVNTVNETFVDAEKREVDRLLDLAANSGIVDLEMGLPAWGDMVSAPRIDLVALERARGRLTVFFGEIKLVDDGRLRSSKPVETDKNPEVLCQLRHYRRYLESPDRRKLVAEQYVNAAKLLKGVHEAAANADIRVRPLGDAITAAAAGEEIFVEPLPRLIVINDANANQTAWKVHEAKLETERARVPMRVLNGAEPLKFGEWP